MNIGWNFVGRKISEGYHLSLDTISAQAKPETVAIRTAIAVVLNV